MLQTRTRVENPARWQKAAERAVAEGIQIRQLQSTGQWVATSGSDKSLAYQIEVTGAVAHGCDCLAGLNGDSVCKHRAAYNLLVGAIDLTPEPEPPAPTICPVCDGNRVIYDPIALKYGGWNPKCTACQGTGRIAA
jgi:hypothetical protein